MAVTLTRLYAACPRGAAFRICTFQTEAPFLSEDPFLPSLEFTELALNIGVLKAAGQDGTHVLAAFGSLPYIFVFNGAHEHVHTIRFLGSDIRDQAHNIFVKHEGGVGTRRLWQTLDLLSPELLAISTSHRVYFIRLGEKEHFTHAATIRLSTERANESETEMEYVLPMEVDYHDGYL